MLRKGGKHRRAALASLPPCTNVPPIYLLDLAQGAFQVGEVAGTKRLDARLVVAVKRRDGPRAARFLGFLGVGKPQPQMEGVHWLELGVLLGVLVVHLWRFHAARGDGEHLFAEDAYETLTTVAIVVGGYVALVPGDAEGVVGLLDDEQGVLRVLTAVPVSIDLCASLWA